MKEKEIVQKICQYIDYQQQNGATISASDYSQDRKYFMVAVGITNTEKIYPTLPDFKYTVSIVIDCFIAEDPKGIKLNQIKSLIDEKFNGLDLKEVFGEIPIVGILNKSKEFSIVQQSNRIEYEFELFGSF